MASVITYLLVFRKEIAIQYSSTKKLAGEHERTKLRDCVRMMRLGARIHRRWLAWQKYFLNLYMSGMIRFFQMRWFSFLNRRYLPR